VVYLFLFLFSFSPLCSHWLFAAIPTNDKVYDQLKNKQNDKQNDPFVKIKDMNCDQLIATSRNVNYNLNNLAGIRAHKNCPNFKFDFTTLSNLEKKLYSSEVDQALKSDQSEPTSATTPSIAEQEDKQIKELILTIKKEKKISDKITFVKKLRNLYKSLNRKAEVISTSNDLYTLTFKQFKQKKKDQKFQESYLEAGVYLARQLWTNDNGQKAQDILKVVIKSLKNKINIYEAYLMLGRIHDEQGQFETAVNYYDMVLEELKKSTPKGAAQTKDRVQWIKSWILYKNQKWAQAFKALKNYEEDTPENNDKIKAQYFQARCLEKQSKFDDAQKIYTKLTQDDFYSYYSLLSYKAIGKNIPTFNSLKATQKFPFDSDLTFLSLNYKLLFLELIKQEELDLTEKLIPLITENLESTVNAAIYLAQNGKRFIPLFASYAKLTTEQKQDIIVKYPHLIFPRLYESDIEEMATKTGTPSSLIYSIIRQESAFNPEAKSHANAYGLMQIIPDLAKKLAKKFKFNYQKTEDLLVPEKNIVLGTYELSEQIKKQKDNYTLVAAAYNAGPNAVSKWLKIRAKSHFDLIDFIEEIPYDETRTYVKVVARNHLFYDRLKNPAKEIAFPENYLHELPR